MYFLAQMTVPDVGFDVSDIITGVTAFVTAWVLPGLALSLAVMLAFRLWRSIRGRIRF